MMSKTGRNRIVFFFVAALYAVSFLLPGPSQADDEAPLIVATVTAQKQPTQTAVPRTLELQQVAQLPDLTAAAKVDIGLANGNQQQVQEETDKPAVTTIGNVYVRSGPGRLYDTVEEMAANAPVEVIGKDITGSWVMIGQDGRSLGWVAISGLFGLTIETVNRLPVVTPREVVSRFDATLKHRTNLYTGPATYYPVAARNVPASIHINIAGRTKDNTWALIADEQGFAGWVAASALVLQPGFDLETVTIIDRLPPVTVSNFEWGGQTHDLLNTQTMTRMGMSWAKVQYKWRPDSKPTDVQDAIRRAHNAGLKILLAIPGEPYPDEPIDYVRYVQFLRNVAMLPDPPDAIEVWNEMNTDFEWPVGMIDPALYVTEMLAPAYTAIKEVNPDIMVISGAPAPTGFDNGRNAWADDRYVAGMVAAGAMAYTDCIGVHYNAGATSPHATTGHPAGSYYGWYFMPSLAMYYQAFGGQRPLCITEIGYLTQDGSRNTLPERFWWAEGTTLAEQGKWLSEAVSLADESKFVHLLIVFSVDIQHWDDYDPQGGYSMIRMDGSCPTCRWFTGEIATQLDPAQSDDVAALSTQDD